MNANFMLKLEHLFLDPTVKRTEDSNDLDRNIKRKLRNWLYKNINWFDNNNQVETNESDTMKVATCVPLISGFHGACKSTYCSMKWRLFIPRHLILFIKTCKSTVKYLEESSPNRPCKQIAITNIARQSNTIKLFI